MKNFNIRNPLSIIAMFCTITEGLCLYALPKLTVNNQNVFIWFVISFPVILLFLFFFTIIKHHTKLYSPSDFDTKDNSFVEIFYEKSFTKNEHSTKQITQSAISNSFKAFVIDNSDKEDDKRNLEFINNIFQELDSVLPKHKLSRVFYKQINSICYLIDIEIKSENLSEETEGKFPFVLMIFETEGKINPILAGSGIQGDVTGEKIINYIMNILGNSIK